MFALLTRVFNMDVIDRTIVNPFKMIIFECTINYIKCGTHIV